MTFLNDNVLLAAVALVLEAACDYPAPLQRRIGHPVQWLGAWIAALERALNRPERSVRTRSILGGCALVLILAVAVLPAVFLQSALRRLVPPLGANMLLALPAAALLASRSLFAHVGAVVEARRREGLAGARAAVSHIVGRNPQSLDAAGVMRAAIESLAENFSDAVVAPALWCALLGLPGIALYKAANTADSMLGHRTERLAAFGWAAARFDDLINLPASRLAALWLTLAALFTPHASARAACRAAWRDAPRHRSPNAGWPEAATAGALGLSLAGPRVYGETLVDDAWMGSGRKEANSSDVLRALTLTRRAALLQIIVVAALAMIARG
ncbi:MAG: adenosylcobinamide-phosphate synthase CbiB [Acidobacteriia bacterium]|nr:cobalamin biosynthesis protein CobD [Methyloceanibacter sp.]MCL6492405.1 adenosylcobinamide-phosphate synthase CbiB [Terriglobia bacterium]